jgi:peptidoglycan biosynthesis protein MviN/MurJ (putative lipid II flippase)
MGAGPMLASSFFSLYYAAGKGRVALVFTLAWTVADWGIGVPLVLRFGFVGIAWRGLIESSLSTPFALWQARRVVAFRWAGQLVPGALLALAIGAFTWLLFRVLPMTALGTIGGAALALTAFAAAAAVIERGTLKAVVSDLRPRMNRVTEPGGPLEPGLLPELRR